MAGLGDLLGGLLGGSNAGSSQMKSSNRTMKEAIQMLKDIGIPEIEAQRIALESPELVGQITAEQLGPSAFENISVDPRLREAQMSALSQMSGLAEQGFSDTDKAQFAQMQRQAEAQDQARQASILQQMAEQGQGDSGARLIAQLQSGQAATDRVAQQGRDMAGQAAAARRSATSDKANMASNIRGQDTALTTDQARAMDIAKQFNAQARQSVQQQNAANKQAVENARVATRNTQETANKGLIQNQFNNQIEKGKLVSNAATGQATNLSNQATAAGNAAQAQTGQLISAGTDIFSALYGKK